MLDWAKKQCGHRGPAIGGVEPFAETDIFQFDQILAEKLYALDGETFAEPLDGEWKGSTFR